MGAPAGWRCLALGILLLLPPGETGAEGDRPSNAGSLPPIGAIAPAWLTPDRLGHAAAAALWRESVEYEEAERFFAAAAAAERVVEILPGNVHTHWRIARDYMQALDHGPPLSAERREETMERSRAWARRGRALDERCGECCFYDFAATARLAALRGAGSSLRLVREAARTLETCLDSPPTWSDSSWRHERANLFHGASTFYRLLPDSRWIGFVVGARGDRRRAVALGRRAVALAPLRTDYVVGLGASLVCVGTREHDDEALAEGLRWLERAASLPELMDTDAEDRARASRMRQNPSEACHDSRDGAVHFD